MNTKNRTQTGIKVTTGLKGGGLKVHNHNRTRHQVTPAIKVTSCVKAGGLKLNNHNRAIVLAPAAR
jgi:hypothetical protein